MSGQWAGKKSSPGPNWATIQEPASSDDDDEVMKDAYVKKRKVGGDHGASGRGMVGSSSKRPRHSVPERFGNSSGVKGASLSTSGFDTLRTREGGKERLGANASAESGPFTAPSSPTSQRHRQWPAVLPTGVRFQKKPLFSRSVTHPVPGISPSDSGKATSIAGSSANGASTALMLAAQLSSANASLSASMKERRRDRHERVKVQGKGKEKERSPVTPEYFGDSSDGNASSTGVMRSSGAGVTNRGINGGNTGSRMSALAESSMLREARNKDEHGPLYVNQQRQTARKTGGMSKPFKKHRFDRQVTSSGSDSSVLSLSESDRMDVDKDRGGPSSKKETLQIGRKSVVGVPLSRTLPSSSGQSTGKGKGKEMAGGTMRPRPAIGEVIIIDSSDDDEIQLKPGNTILPPKSSHKTTVKNESRSPPSAKVGRDKENQGHKQAAPGPSLNLIDALNKTYQRHQSQHQPQRVPGATGKSLKQEIIDLTIDSSDEASAGAPASKPVPKSPQSPTKSGSLSSWVKRYPRSQPDSSTQAPASPTKLSMPALSPKKSPLKPGKTVDLLTKSPREESSVHSGSTPEATLATEESRSTKSSHSPPLVAEPSPIPTLSPKSLRDEGASTMEEEQVDHDLMPSGPSEPDNDVGVSDRPGSSSASSRISPELIPPLRRSLRNSSGSSFSETEHLRVLSDGELVESPPASSPSSELEDGECSPTYGGFKALTWEQHKKDLKNFDFKHYLARDIPTSLPDIVNHLSPHTRMDQGMRDVFRAFMLESNEEDESEAPDIEIINDIDNEPAPLFEFCYSNRMWYGESVPLPDYTKLKGCDCVGKCDPKSKTCACAIRHRGYTQMEEGFVYEKTGRLKHPRYPIFECNDLCACDSDCRNRVVQHGRKYQVNIKKTANKGWGVFNGPKKMPKGTFIGIYAGELLTDEQGEVRGRYYNKIGKTYLFDIDFWHLRKEEEGEEWTSKYTVDAYHAGNFTRFLNHSCDPNARLYACYINEPDIDKPLLVVFSTRDIEPHEEICFSYAGRYPDDGDDDDEEQKQEKRDDPIYTECKCGAWNCTGMMFK